MTASSAERNGAGSSGGPPPPSGGSSPRTQPSSRHPARARRLPVRSRAEAILIYLQAPAQMLPKHDMRYLRGLEFDGLRRELPVIADAGPMLNAHRDANLRLNLLVDAPEPTFAVERCRRAAHFLRMENARREAGAIEIGQGWAVRNRD